MSEGISNEAKIFVNGVELTNAQSMAVRVAVEFMLNDLDSAEMRAMLMGADFVKTSTGFALIKTPKGLECGGATVEDVALMSSVVSPVMGVKAAGGIRDYKTFMAMIKAGATRIGTSAGVAIVKEALEAKE